ncbi:hypothetical protein Moror_6376 [Moniliophthora roreri MCA 2997]|uniref:Uncharacterized protein n=1 Tax=Moniliophthora roreri (strain MCA 2997) TaxID=1381753 RepID=V2XXB7_MONRO|nr:hypothetical protein Moror_6376 [Moniliophthora roreri MCA 2997]
MAMLHMRCILFCFCVSLTYFQLTAARDHNRPNANIMRRPGLPRVVGQVSAVALVDADGNSIPPYTQEYWFDQLIDHQNPRLGTFKQRYFHTWEFYKQDSWKYLTNTTINGQFAQNFSGATIVLEHRFFGPSNPRPDLSEESLKYLTIQQAMDDLVYFAKNVQLPMPGGDQVPPNKVPWILIGGSYSGTQVSSGQVTLLQASYNRFYFWQYYEPIRQNMPQNCSADVQRVIAFVDESFASGDQARISAVKANFGLQDLLHADDVVGALRNPIWDWQMLQPYASDRSFFDFCDALEVKDGVNAPSSGWGLTYAYEAMGRYFRTFYLDELCGTGVPVESCLDTYDSSWPYWTDPALDNETRSWLWMVCSEVGWYQIGPQTSQAPALVSQLVSEQTYQRTCTMYFPKTFTLSDRPKVLKTTSSFHGWDVQVQRLFVANGRRDPWLEATLSATSQNIASTDMRPIVISDGFHCSDMSTNAAVVDPTILDVQQKALTSVKGWLSMFQETNLTETTPSRGNDTPENAASRPDPMQYCCVILGWITLTLYS